MDKKKSVLGAFGGDALALGPHWIYDTAEIKLTFGTISGLNKPVSKYHPSKEKGDFTHYGDQMLVLLESITAQNKFDLNDFAERWKKLFADYNDYVDHATKDTLAGFEAGKSVAEAGSDSTDLSIVGRCAPLLLVCDDLNTLLEATRAVTAMTHNSTECLESSVFFMSVAYYVIGGKAVKEAITEVAAESSDIIKKWVKEGINSAGKDTTEAIKTLGASCAAQGAFPSTIHCLVKYNNARESLIACVMAGGDNAARAMIIGMVSGCPEEWVKGMKKFEKISTLLDSF
jgi:ADP-ribosylglycohydrolase